MLRGRQTTPSVRRPLCFAHRRSTGQENPVRSRVEMNGRRRPDRSRRSAMRCRPRRTALPIPPDRSRSRGSTDRPRSRLLDAHIAAGVDHGPGSPSGKRCGHRVSVRDVHVAATEQLERDVALLADEGEGPAQGAARAADENRSGLAGRRLRAVLGQPRDQACAAMGSATNRRVLRHHPSSCKSGWPGAFPAARSLIRPASAVLRGGSERTSKGPGS